MRDTLTTERDAANNELLMRARVTQLWQTRMLRYTKLTVADEIENALSYYQTTFLRQIPRMYRELEDALPGHPIAPFFRMGNWIGGDRDGNPNVTADTLQMALRRQSETVLRFYLTEVHELGAELSISALLAPVTPAMQALLDETRVKSRHVETVTVPAGSDVVSTDQLVIPPVGGITYDVVEIFGGGSVTSALRTRRILS